MWNLNGGNFRNALSSSRRTSLRTQGLNNVLLDKILHVSRQCEPSERINVGNSSLTLPLLIGKFEIFLIGCQRVLELNTGRLSNIGKILLIDENNGQLLDKLRLKYVDLAIK
jgi:hypothetical protein